MSVSRSPLNTPGGRMRFARPATYTIVWTILVTGVGKLIYMFLKLVGAA